MLGCAGKHGTVARQVQCPSFDSDIECSAGPSMAGRPAGGTGHEWPVSAPASAPSSSRPAGRQAPAGKMGTARPAVRGRDGMHDRYGPCGERRDTPHAPLPCPGRRV
jgi:hypothetical protein